MTEPKPVYHTRTRRRPKTIYLIGETGAATTSDEAMAYALEHISGYTRCTKDEYYARMRKIRALDTAATEE